MPLREVVVFLSSNEVFEWLARFINLERGQKPKSFRIDRMEFLARLSGNPQRCAPSIHIAGSKGKGSVTGMLAAMLTEAGFRAARFMSPHVVDVRERICLGDSYFDEEIYRAAGDELREITEACLPSASNPLFDPTTEDGCEPTYFELLTLFFFLCARRGSCDVMVVETGMGGRLDSTNILDPLVSVITLIELEHTSFLGNTIAKIAEEKAGIIKNGKPLILAKQREEALEVFREKTKEKNSPLLYLPKIAEISNIKINKTGTDFTVVLENNSHGGTAARREIEIDSRCASQTKGFMPPCDKFSSLSLSIPIPGQVQAENAALAISAIKTAFPKIGEDVICKGLGKIKLPARFEKIAEAPPFIIDGAHTPESLALTIETFCSLYGEGGVLIFGCAADKDAAAMAHIAHPHFSKIIITTPGNFKVSNPAETYEAFAVQAGKEKTLLVTDTKEAVKEAVEAAKEFTQRRKDAKNAEISSNIPRIPFVPPCLRVNSFSNKSSLPILATGSFYLVAEIRKILAV
jgi:dihydrofolate synthase/folylpolyglutamate synthase